MIHSITFNKQYSVEPMLTTDNPKAISKKIKLNRWDRGWKRDGENFYNYTYIPLFKKGLNIEFKNDVNLIVGDNGTGKTQLFKVIKDKLNNRTHKFPLDCYIDFDEETEILIFDLVNGLIKDIIKPNPLGDSRQFNEDSLFKLNYSDKSHGENVKAILDFAQEFKGKTVLLDEPESGLSIKSQIELIEKIKELSKCNQLFIITHSKFLIDAFEEVYYFDEHKWLSKEKFYKKLGI